MTSEQPASPAVAEAERLTRQLFDFADELDRLGERVRTLARQKVAEQQQEGSHDRPDA